MSFKFGTTSKKRLSTCHKDLIVFGHYAIATSPVDFTIVCGWRGEAEQEEAFSDGNSKARWGQSPHNNMKGGDPLSLAVDIVPYVDGKLIWDVNYEAFKELSTHLSNTARYLYECNAIENNIEWAYAMWGWDAPHWQLRGWKDLRG